MLILFISINLQYEKLTVGDDGSVVRSEFVVEGCKQPLTVVREHFLKSHACYMRNVSDKEFANMSKEELTKRLSRVNAVFCESDDAEVLRTKLKEISTSENMA